MSNPWTKKNPLMSMWLSSANRAVGSARGRTTVQLKSAAHQATNKAVGDMSKAWLDLYAPGGLQRKKRR